MQHFVKIIAALCFWAFSALCVHAQTGVSKTISVKTVPDGADVHIKYYKNGDIIEQKMCSSPCVHHSSLDRTYYVEIKKQNYANYSFRNHLTFTTHQGISTSIPALENNNENVDWFQYKQTKSTDEYVVILETENQKKFRENQLELGRAKNYLAKNCPTIFDKHYITGDRLARPCKVGPTSVLLNDKQCSFIFDVRASGFINNVRDVSCSSPYNEKTLSKINWIDSEAFIYFPEIKNGKAVRSTGLTFSTDLLTNDPQFACTEKIAKYDEILTHDAVPCIRQTPQYPKKLKGNHICEVTFDVSASGKTKNIEIQKCTHKKVKNPTIETVGRWIYLPKKIDGTPVGRSGVRSRLKFMKH